MKKQSNLFLLTGLLTFVNYLVFYVFNSLEVFSSYQLVLILVAIIYSKNKTTNLKTTILLIIATMSIFVTYLNSNYFLVTLSYYIYFISLFYTMRLFNNQKEENLLLELHSIIVYPLDIIINLIEGCAEFIANIKKNIANNDHKEYGQIFYGFIAAIPAIIIITIMLFNYDGDFANIFNFLFIPKLIFSLVSAVMFTSLLDFYNNTKITHEQNIVQKINKVRKGYFKNYSFANMFLLSILPVQLLFVIYELKKLFEYTLLYGENVSKNYSMIIFVVIINCIFIIIFYYFYKGREKIALFTRNLLLTVNYLLLTITGLQVIIYVINASAITEKRYYALLSILIMFIINGILQIKSNKKSKNILKYVYVIMLIIFVSFMMIDADSVVYHYNTSHNTDVDTEYLQGLNPKWQ